MSTSNISDLTHYPVISIEQYLNTENDEDTCKQIAELLHNYGILIIQDPRVPSEDNETFIDLMEQYFEQDDVTKSADIRKEHFYQVGVTPSMVEQARDHCQRAKQYSDENRPMTICPPEADTKCRFFWRIGDRPSTTNYQQLNADPVIPAAFADRWETIMNDWGNKMLSTVRTVSEMAALGMNLSKDTFTSLMNYGPHLLAPTGSDLKTHNKLGTTFAAYHYDLNFITIHGRSRYPGLFIWTRDGRKMMVKVPPKCLLLQAGKQFEWLTGGEVLAGFHEVVVVKETQDAIKASEEAGRSLWRVSSTLFSHIASDNILQPLGHFANDESLKNYPPTPAGKQVQDELDAIKLGKDQIAGF